MTRWLKGVCLALALLLLLVAGLWLTIARWLPIVAQHWLPQGSSLRLDARPYWSDGALRLPGARYLAGDCVLAGLFSARLNYQQGRWLLVADDVNVDTDCLRNLPTGDDTRTPLALDVIQRALPTFDLAINHLSVTPWQAYAGGISLTNDQAGQNLRYRGEKLSLDAHLDDKQRLTLHALTLRLPQSEQPITLDGEVQIPLDLASLPRNGALEARFQAPFISGPLTARLRWQENLGELTLSEQDAKEPLAQLPWQLEQNRIAIDGGQWRWPYAQQPLAGGVSLTLSDWDKSYSQSQLQARFNLLTKGHNGKGNVVVTVGPGNIGLIDSDLSFRITGQVNKDNLSVTASLPGTLRGPLLNPEMTLESGSLLRAWGKLDDQTTLSEARWPLAGIKVNHEGVSGRLQAIVQLKDAYWGDFRLHLDGKAEKFLPDQGIWQWQYWGNGDLPPLNARWDVGGRGAWSGSTVRLTQLSTGFDRLHYGMMNVEKPRLTLTKPLTWQRDSQADSAFGGSFQLDTPRIAFDYGGFLPHAVLNLTASGRGPDAFLLKGDLQAGKIGPISLNGRWDGERLRGQAWWAKQSATVFQPLISSDLKMKLRDGSFYGQAAFSAARVQGFEAGGHLVVKDAGMWLTDGEMSGLDFLMSYRMKNQRWQLGVKQPVSLRIRKLDNLFPLQNISADLQGYYPYSDKAPLVLSNVGVDMLGGHAGFEALRFPRPMSAVLKLRGVDLSELFTALKPKQFAMSGKVDGELPLYLDDPHWLVRDGWIDNASLLTLRLDPQMADAIAENNMVGGAAIDWLRYMEISRSRAEVNLDNLGMLTMAATVHGMNPQKSAHREVVLNYHHEENVFQLWRSLRFGDNLQEWLEQNLSLPARKGHEQQ